jgi:peptide/nickel transport system substrate-binding protein
VRRRSLFIFKLLSVVLVSLAAAAQSELRFCLGSDPKTFNPLLVEDDSSETIRYLTGGVLLRVNRLTQDAEPELATSWKVTGGKTITIKLREGIRFSDGTPFSAEDVAYTVGQLMDPALHSPTGDAFRSGEGKVLTSVLAPDRITITFPAPIAGLAKLFDQVAIMSANRRRKRWPSWDRTT